MKRVMVSATFPQAAASKAKPSASGEGSTIPTATRRALEKIMERDGIKGKRNITHFTLSVTVEDVDDAGKADESDADD